MGYNNGALHLPRLSALFHKYMQGWQLKKSAKGDPVPTFLQCFYNSEVGKEAPEARVGPRNRRSR